MQITKKSIFSIEIHISQLYEKNLKFFFHPYMTIHTPIESPYRVFSKNADFRNVWIDIWLKTPKNHVKICILKGSFEKTKKSIFSIEKAYSYLLRLQPSNNVRNSHGYTLNKLVKGRNLKCMF
jgi:hypothetical protein